MGEPRKPAAEQPPPQTPPSTDRAPRGGRRRFLYAGGAAIALAGGFPLVQALSAEAPSRWRPGPFGPLRPDPDGILDLPEGFTYRILSRSGDAMDDGLRVPSRPDGMACFALEDGSLALLRNHENPAGISMLGPWTGRPSEHAWRPSGMGGVSRLVLDPATLAPRSSNLVLGGTVMNCSGGPSPWGWLSCEETHSRDHGLVFACDPRADRVAPARPIPGYGRFRHEAACVDPATSIAYLSEDRDDSCLYRFVPHDPSRPFEGELSALAIRGRRAGDTARGLRTGERLEVAWVPLRDPDPEEGDVLRHLARRDGAAIIARGEGMAFDPTRGAIVLSASSGGPAATGQIFRLEPDADGGELVVLAQSEGTTDFDMPDNVVVSPHGVVYFCEDGHDRNFLRGLDASGRVFDFARNAASRSELAGVCFSPDGRSLFVNAQTDGLTLAVTGPFAAA